MKKFFKQIGFLVFIFLGVNNLFCMPENKHKSKIEKEKKSKVKEDKKTKNIFKSVIFTSSKKLEELKKFDALINLYYLAFKNIIKENNLDFFNKDWNEKIESLQDKIYVNGGAILLVLVLDQESNINGFIIFIISRDGTIVPDLMAINPRCQGQGLGVSLFGFIVKYCKILQKKLGIDFKNVNWVTQEENEGAQKFYAKLGFESIGIAQDSDCNKGENVVYNYSYENFCKKINDYVSGKLKKKKCENPEDDQEQDINKIFEKMSIQESIHRKKK